MRRRFSRLTLLIGALPLVLAACSTSTIEDNATFGWPKGVTEQAHKMRVLWTWSSIAALIIGAMVWFLIFFACARFRKRDDELPRQTKYNLPLEIVYTIIPFVLIVGLFYYTVVTENYVLKRTANPDVTVQVDAFKWNWQFEYVKHNVSDELTYAGSEVHPSTVGSSTEIPILVVPVGKKVRVVEHSADVIHSFWVPEFLFKLDVIPYGAPTTDTSRDNQFEFTATTTGSFVGRCAELCGTYHSQMNFEVRVVQPDVFENYVSALQKITPDSADFASRQSVALKAAMPNESPYATTTYPFNTDRTAREESKR